MTEPVELAEPVEDPEPRPRRGHGVLIACVFVVAALAIVGGAFAIVGSLTHGFKKPVVIHYKKSAIFSLRTGECIDPNGQAATIVSCSTPHDAEVFATFSLSGSKWPGTTAVRAAASSGCSTRLTGYLNPQLAISLASTYIYPDSVAWQAGDPHGDLRGAGDKRAAHRLGARRLRHRQLGHPARAASSRPAGRARPAPAPGRRQCPPGQAC